MKKDTHPAFHEVVFTCSCGNTIKVGSTMQKDSSHIDVCLKCHPFYTGKQKISDAGGRLKKFREKYSDTKQSGAAAE